ncbi:hypothetical protein [uncultured marine virus]|uniref:ATP-dependent helicase Rep n=1 Tax=uncultured marine virus TaxID=186617 RepID=S4TF43_9VIRU|nr:hypothetical protein [uncultured marine virus]
MPRAPGIRSAPPQQRAWCFTLNNPGEWRPVFDDSMRLLVYQLERGDMGTPHLQGYVKYLERKTFAAVKTLWPSAHLEPAKASPMQNLAYCTKPEGRLDGPWKYGDWERAMGNQGERNDWHDIKAFLTEQLQLGVLTEDELFDEVIDRWPAKAREERAVRVHTEACKRRLMRSAIAVNPSAGERSPPQIVVLWGPTGSGKTRRAWEEAGPLAYSKPQGQWFDGYRGQANVILDEWPDETIGIQLVLQMLDRYPLMVAVKGSFASWCPRRVWLTSNIEPSAWFPEASQRHRDALRRRLRDFGTIINVTGSAAVDVDAAPQTPPRSAGPAAGAGYAARDPYLNDMWSPPGQAGRWVVELAASRPGSVYLSTDRQK